MQPQHLLLLCILLTFTAATPVPHLAQLDRRVDCTGMKGCMNKAMANGKASFYRGGMAFMDGNQAGIKGFQIGLNKGQNGFQKSTKPKSHGPMDRP